MTRAAALFRIEQQILARAHQKNMRTDYTDLYVRDDCLMPVLEIIKYDFDQFSLDVKNQKLLKNGEVISLTHKAVQTLLILVQNFGQIIDKEDIYKQVWVDSFVEDANLTQYIYIGSSIAKLI